jgi:nucleotide-binding universal stress UspA family protein
VSATQFLILVVVAWIAIGLVAGYVMARRGHQPLAWWALGAVFGPLVLVLAIDSILREKQAGAEVLETGKTGPGSQKVLVGVDGSPESLAALSAVVDILGSRISEIMLAGVVPYEGELPGTNTARNLAEAASGVSPAPTTIQLTGDPGNELAALAQRDRYDLLVIGTRGRGLSSTMLGSVARHLMAQAAVPLLVVNRRAAAVSGESRDV